MERNGVVQNLRETLLAYNIRQAKQTWKIAYPSPNISEAIIRVVHQIRLETFVLSRSQLKIKKIRCLLRKSRNIFLAEQAPCSFEKVTIRELNEPKRENLWLEFNNNGRPHFSWDDVHQAPIKNMTYYYNFTFFHGDEFGKSMLMTTLTKVKESIDLGRIAFRVTTSSTNVILSSTDMKERKMLRF